MCGTCLRTRHLDTGGDPYLIDLLDVQGVLRADLPDLRLVTQAGGALPAHRVRDIAQRGQAHGWSLAVMYGQTEATARMAVLPPAYATRHPDAVGWPVAGSSFSWTRRFRRQRAGRTRWASWSSPVPE